MGGVEELVGNVVSKLIEFQSMCASNHRPLNFCIVSSNPHPHPTHFRFFLCILFDSLTFMCSFNKCFYSISLCVSCQPTLI